MQKISSEGQLFLKLEKLYFGPTLAPIDPKASQ